MLYHPGAMSSSPLFFLKVLSQLGFRPLALNALYKVGLWTGHYQRLDLQALRDRRSAGSFHPLFTLPQSDTLLQTLGKDGKAALLAEADEIRTGKVRLFGADPVPLELAGPWPQVHWTEYERGRVKLEGDIKFIWEPARFGWVYVLGRAYFISQDEKYSLAFWKYLEQFEAGNPPYLGPNWMNGQEVAIRLMALVWAVQIFEAGSTSSEGQRLLRAIAAHAQRIPSTLIYARSQNNNHLITEAAALYTAGLALGNSNWRAMGWRWLNRAFQDQISTYGEYIQHSTNYHRLMLQTALWINAIKDREWPHPTLVSLTRAAHWLFSMLDPATGQTPNLGANDGALILPLAAASFGDFRPTVQAAARAFLRTGLPSGAWDELSLWLNLAPSARTSDSDAYLTDHLRGIDSWAYLRASRFRSRLSHIDQLHFDLWWRGKNIAQDAGTYLYNAEAPWDNPLVSARVHNTITVDGLDPMTRGGRFMTLDWFPAYSRTMLDPDESILGRVVAYHHGYRRLGIFHERTVTVQRDGRWIVADRLVPNSSATHSYRLHWLLMDGEWSMEDGGSVFRIKSPEGWITLRLRSDPKFPNSASRISLVRAGELLYGTRTCQPYEGWVSKTYGRMIPALSLALELTSQKTVTFNSEFMFPR